MTFDISRQEWRARSPARSYVNISMTQRPGTETHHSVGLYGASQPHAFAREVQRDHLGRGWTDVFYNRGIWLDGTIIELRPHNAKSGPISHLTIVFAGNYNNRNITQSQKEAWHRIRNWSISNGARRGVAWHGQRARVACPGSDIVTWLADGYPLEKDMATPAENWSYLSKDGRSMEYYQRVGSDSARKVAAELSVLRLELEELQQHPDIDITELASRIASQLDVIVPTGSTPQDVVDHLYERLGRDE